MIKGNRSQELLELEEKYRTLRLTQPPITTTEPRPELQYRGPSQHPLAQLLDLSTAVAENDEPNTGFRSVR